MTTVTTSGATPLPFQVASPLFYMVVGAGSILVVLITCIVVLSLCIGCICLQQNRANSTRQLENSEVHKKSEMTTLSKKERDTFEASIIQPQCYTIEENPAYSATSTVRQDLFDYEANPAYTLVEAPHKKQGIPMYHEILDLSNDAGAVEVQL